MLESMAPILRDKADELARKLGIADFVATEGWFQRWKKRENIISRRTSKFSVALRLSVLLNYRRSA